MRIAVVSDIHGSLAALQAMEADLEKESPELVVHGGDLVVNGPRPAEVIDRIREFGWPGVVGNTDEILWAPERQQEMQARVPRLINLLRVLFEAAAPATREMLGEERITWLRSLPPESRHEDLLVLHASPGDMWSAPMPDASDEELENVYSGVSADLVVYGHIHRPYVRRLSGLTVANSGSVGMPYDGDPRASYLLIEDGVMEIRRVEYELERSPI